jgi:ubiquinone biosynthesis protein
LERLQDDVAAIPFADVDAVVREAIGPDWKTRFLTVHEAPLATASIAQVHRATLTDGTPVVLKVQRPGIGPKIKADLSILHLLARRLLVEFPEARSFDPTGILIEFERSITAELEFQTEARNMAKVAANFADKSEIVQVPRVFPALSTRTVLTMEFLEGVKIRDARAAGFDMERVGARYLEVAYDMLFVHGFFHGDLHPGNVLVLPGERIGLLDFGMVGRLNEEMRGNIFALQKGDERTIARLCWEIAIKEERVDFRAVERVTAEIVERHWSGSTIREMQLGPFLTDLARAAARHGARIPAGYTMFFKAVLTSEGLAKSLIDEVDPIAAAEPYIRRFLAEQLSEDALQREVLRQAGALVSLVRHLPGSVGQLLDDLDAQRITILVRDPDAEARDAAADRRTNRAVLAAYTIGAFACGTAALPFSVVQVWGVPVLSIVFYLIGSALFLVNAGMVLRNRG